MEKIATAPLSQVWYIRNIENFTVLKQLYFRLLFIVV